jgi:hypothetical protein
MNSFNYWSGRPQIASQLVLQHGYCAQVGNGLAAEKAAHGSGVDSCCEADLSHGSRIVAQGFVEVANERGCSRCIYGRVFLKGSLRIGAFFRYKSARGYVSARGTHGAESCALSCKNATMLCTLNTYCGDRTAVSKGVACLEAGDQGVTGQIRGWRR